MTADLMTIDLDDGSRVFLNARSAIDVKLAPAFRQVILHEGQAYFEIAEDHDRPLSPDRRLFGGRIGDGVRYFQKPC